MLTKLTCPDCGGVLGDRKPGEAPCTCFAPNEDANSDTAQLDSPSTVEKLCVVCGKDTVGHRRLKDSRGYICYPCAKAEKAAEKEGKVRCQLCKKLIKPSGLVPLNRQMVCRSCHADFEERAKFTKKLSMKQYETDEKQRVVVLAIVLVILGGIVVYSLFMKHGRASESQPNPRAKSATTSAQL